MRPFRGIYFVDKGLAGISDLLSSKIKVDHSRVGVSFLQRQLQTDAGGPPFSHLPSVTGEEKDRG